MLQEPNFSKTWRWALTAVALFILFLETFPNYISVKSDFTGVIRKSVMFCEVESNVKMTRCKLQGGDGEVETGEQGEADLVTG